MKKILAIIIISATSVWSQMNYRVMTFKVGFYYPEDLSKSYIVGGDHTFRLTNTKEFGIGIDYFGRYEKDEVTVKDKSENGPVMETEIQTNAEQRVHLIPIYTVLRLKYPILYKHFYYFTGSLGYQVLYSNLKAYDPENYKSSNRYQGIKWSVGTGFMYRLSHRYAVIMDISYHSAKVSREKNITGPPVKCVVDLSGFIFQIGLRKGFF